MCDIDFILKTENTSTRSCFYLYKLSGYGCGEVVAGAGNVMYCCFWDAPQNRFPARFTWELATEAKPQTLEGLQEAPCHYIQDEGDRSAATQPNTCR